MTATPNWIRHVSLTVGSISTNNLTIHFTIDSSCNDAATATATIKIYNLSPASAARISLGDRVTLSAGYSRDHGLIYLGRVQSRTTGRDGADTYTELACVDYTWPTQMPTRTYPKGTQIGSMIRTLYADTLLPEGPIITDHGVTCSDAYTTDPDGKTTLDQLLAMINGDPEVSKNNLTVHHAIIAGTACIVAENQTLPETYVLTAKTGLLETSPETDDTADQSATVLLLWRVQVDTVILLTTETTSGRYKVVSYRHRADNDRYQTELKLKIV